MCEDLDTGNDTGASAAEASKPERFAPAGRGSNRWVWTDRMLATLETGGGRRAMV